MTELKYQIDLTGPTNKLCTQGRRCAKSMYQFHLNRYKLHSYPRLKEWHSREGEGEEDSLLVSWVATEDWQKE